MTKLTPLERKIVRRAAELAAENYWSSFSCLAIADRRFDVTPIWDQFREFFWEYGCPFKFCDDSEQLRTTRVLLLLTFLHFDGVIE